jgi:hypothetical protein
MLDQLTLVWLPNRSRGLALLQPILFKATRENTVQPWLVQQQVVA